MQDNLPLPPLPVLTGAGGERRHGRGSPGVPPGNKLDLHPIRDRVAGLSAKTVSLFRADVRPAVCPGVYIDIQPALAFIDRAAPAVPSHQPESQFGWLDFPACRFLCNSPGGQGCLGGARHIFEGLRHAALVTYIDIEPAAQGVLYGDM